MYFPVQTAHMPIADLFSQSANRRAIPFHVHDGREEEQVVATLIVSFNPEEPNAQHMGLYMDRENMGTLCCMCIQAHLNQLIQQQLSQQQGN